MVTFLFLNLKSISAAPLLLEMLGLMFLKGEMELLMNVAPVFYSFGGSKTTMIKPIKPSNRPPKNHPATLLFL